MCLAPVRLAGVRATWSAQPLKAYSAPSREGLSHPHRIALHAPAPRPAGSAKPGISSARGQDKSSGKDNLAMHSCSDSARRLRPSALAAGGDSESSPAGPAPTSTPIAPLSGKARQSRVPGYAPVGQAMAMLLTPSFLSDSSGRVLASCTDDAGTPPKYRARHARGLHTYSYHYSWYAML